MIIGEEKEKDITLCMRRRHNFGHVEEADTTYLTILSPYTLHQERSIIIEGGQQGVRMADNRN